MKGKILIADDEKDIVAMTAKLLIRHGYEVIKTYDGASAVDLAREEKPDLILLDVIMPELDGFKVCQILKEDMLLRFIPIIMFTQKKTEKVSRLTGLKIGADEYLSKPVDPEELLIRIEMLIEKKREFVSTQPLTKFPGSATIETKIREKILGKEKFSVCYLDIDHFKSYNDAYGYLKGNDAIIYVSELLLKVMKENTSKESHDVFVGHIGGDDFILVTPIEKVDKICGEIVDEFDGNVNNFYSKEDVEREYVVTRDRRGNMCNFALISLSIAEVNNSKREISDYSQIVSVLAEIKNYLKSLSDRKGSIYLRDRRI